MDENDILKLSPQERWSFLCFGRKTPPEIAFPHLVAPYKWPTLAAIREVAGTCLGPWCEWLYTLDCGTGEYEYTEYSPSRFHNWATRKNQGELRRFVSAGKSTDRFTVFLSTCTRCSILEAIDQEMDSQGLTVSDSDGLLDLFLSYLSELGWLGIVLDPQNNEYILWVFSHPFHDLRDRAAVILRSRGLRPFSLSEVRVTRDIPNE